MKLTLTGRLADCVLLAYRTPKRAVEHLVPHGLDLISRGEWAFWNIVVCRVEALRIAGLPRWCGVSYTHVAYRLYVRAHGDLEEELPGLFFVRSNADRRLIGALGNVLTDLRFHFARLSFERAGEQLRFNAASQDAAASLLARSCESAEWSSGPCFASREEAWNVLKYRPVSLAADHSRLKLTEVFRNEAEWRESPLHVERASWSFPASFAPCALELATRVDPIEYRWRLGRTVKLGRT